MLKTSGSYTYIKYKTTSGSYKRGFVKTSQLNIPTGNLAKPIRTGYLVQDYKTIIHNGKQKHNGIDIGTARLSDVEQPVYAVETGTITMYQRYAEFSGEEYLIGYGNEIELVYNNSSYLAIYAHLSAFTYGEPIIPNNKTKQISANNTSITAKYHVIPPTGSSAAKTVQKGEEIGHTGNTGNSEAAHLHFEIKLNSGQKTNLDPFLYVVFPDVGYYV